MAIRTHKAGFTQWRVDVMNKLGLKFEVKNDKIIYKGELKTTFVSFLIDSQ